MSITEEAFNLGYAIPLYTIDPEVRVWRYRDEEFTLPSSAVPVFALPGFGFPVASIYAVRKAANG